MGLRGLICSAAVLLAASLSAAHAATPCAPVVFPSGQSSVTVQDHVPDVIPLCYRFVAHDGQTASIAVNDGDDMNFGVDSIPHGDTSESGILDPLSQMLPGEWKTHDFKTQDRDYRIYVGSRKPRADTTKTFSMTITLK